MDWRRDEVTDTERLDWLQAQTRGYGLGWLARESEHGRGYRLHETSRPGAHATVRQAIDDARERAFREELLHPTGHCTCGGGGSCAWCRWREPELAAELERQLEGGAQIIQLDEYRPHLVMACSEGHQHVFPVAWVRDLIEGKPVDPLEPCMLREVLREWLEDRESE